MDKGLRQKDVAWQLGVNTDTVRSWESNRTSPKLSYLPKIMEFLGYAPEIASQTPGDQLRAFRRAKGLSQKAFARILGVDPSTLGKWEKGEGNPPERLWDRLRFSPN